MFANQIAEYVKKNHVEINCNLSTQKIKNNIQNNYINLSPESEIIEKKIQKILRIYQDFLENLRKKKLIYWCFLVEMERFCEQ